jgi:protein-disulfide isomerase/uncharacterized membrane protein
VQSQVQVERGLSNGTKAVAHKRVREAVVGRGHLIGMLILCLIGIGISVELTRIHVFVHTDPSYHSICAVSQGVNCETVALSPYSVFAGLPVAVWGICGYALMAALAVWGLSHFRLHATWPLGVLFGLVGVSVCVSAVLAFLSFTRIDSLCLFCTGSYAVNATLLMLAEGTVKRSGCLLWELVALDVKAAIRSPAVLSLAALGCLLMVGLQLRVQPYWRVAGFDDLSLPHGTTDDGHYWIGARTPTVEIAEFSDYQCPHCRTAHRKMRQLVAQRPHQLRLVHRHLPLDQACHPELGGPFHQHACRFAEGAECAGRQGRFWQMNDALISTQERAKAEDVDLEEIAVRLGLNRPLFRACMNDHTAGAGVRKDVQDAMDRNLRGTPTFLVGEQVFLGGIPESEIQKLLAGASGHPLQNGSNRAGSSAER